MSTGGSKFTIYASILANVMIAIMKFIASLFTGSSAMLSEGIHSLIDTVNGLLLLFGINRSKKGPDKLHPFGHGKEIYFWSFIVSILVFSLGGGVAIYEGIHHIINPKEISEHTNMVWNYGVLLGAIVFEGASLLVALKEFRKVHPTGYKSALVESKDAASIAVIIENGAAVAGLIIALIGVTLAYYLDNPVYDAAASILIGILLVYVAFFMAVETKHLLIGESASEKDIALINDIVSKYKQIDFFGNIRTMHLGPDQIMAGMEVNFKDNIPVVELENTVKNIKAEIKKANPKFTHIYIESDSILKSTYN